MRINEVVIQNESDEDVHDRIGLDIEPTDLRYPMYTDAIKRHTKKSRSTNNALHNLYRKGEMPRDFDKTKRASTKDRIQMIDDIMFNHPLKTAITVYHGSVESPWMIYKKNNISFNQPIRLHLPGYISTSTNKNKAINFAKGTILDVDKFLMGQTPAVTKKFNELYSYEFDRGRRFSTVSILQIHTPMGTPALSVKDYSVYSEENEVLLGRGIELHVDPWPRIFGFGVFIWNCKVVGVNPSPHFEN